MSPPAVTNVAQARETSEGARGLHAGAPPWPEEPPPSALSRWLDRFAAEEEWFGRETPPYLSFGTAGAGFGLAAFVALGLGRGLSVALLLACGVAATLSFVLASLARRALTGRETHRLLDDTLIAWGAVALVAWAAGRPPAPVVDLFAIALGIFLVCGRLGCLASGCCHGRPSSFGVRYDFAHASAPCLAGVRLFPLQLAEAAWLALVSAAALAVVHAGGAPGRAAWMWLLAYCAGRFVLDFGRGDAPGPRRFPLTHAQVLALAVLAARIAGEARAGVAHDELVAAGAAALAVVAGWLTRRAWLRVAAPLLTDATAGAWLAWLDERERAARAAPGRDVSGELPGAPELTLTVQIDRGDGGHEVRAYALRAGARPPSPGQARTVAGLVTARLPHHHVLHAGLDARGVYRLWVDVVEPDGVPGLAADDPPAFAVHRARAFGRAVRPAARAAGAIIAMGG